MQITISRTEAFGWGDGSNNYCAIDDDTYDGPGSPCGYGKTPELAEEDLLSQIAERD